MLPVRMRRHRLLALTEGLHSGLAYLHAQFVNYTWATTYRLGITPQVCHLQKLLNDRYDYTARRIWISEEPPTEALPVSLVAENKPVWLPVATENKPLKLPLKGETAGSRADFIINIPTTGMAINPQELIELLNEYKLPTKQFIIKTT